MAVRRKRLARALRFYLDKARRHGLSEQAASRLSVAIDGLFRTGVEQSPEEAEDRGYIFCPEYDGVTAEIGFDGATRIYLFGPHGLPDGPAAMKQEEVWPLCPGATSVPEEILERDESPAADPEATTLIEGGIAESGPAQESQRAHSGAPLESKVGGNGEAALTLGLASAGETPVTWGVSIRGNPHLMIVGLPGMGKTTCVINLCEQLWRQGITPLVFSYHDDIETKLGKRLGQLSLADIDHGLGFNPLRVVGRTPHGWLDNVGMVRDIFAAVYPDLGDLQTNEIREAVKQSYAEVGYGLPDTVGKDLPVPDFRRFYEIIKGKAKPNAGLIARMEELNDYGFFRGAGERASLLESHQTTVIRLHATQNEVLQNATASFVLLNLYQNMFLRGAQFSLTHAVIFDEAHRASRLKLLPTMAKECRKFGLMLIVASQEAKDFSPSLYAAVANYLVLRVTETDAKALAKNVVNTSETNNMAGRLKQLAKYTTMFFAEGKRPVLINLLSE